MRSHPSSDHRAAFRWLLLAATVLGVTASGPVRALALESIAEQSSLGQPLRIVVPVVAQPGEELAGDCFKVVPARAEAVDGIPDVSMARVSLEQSAASNRLVVTTGRVVNEPAMRITLQAGCDRAIRREYLLLFDPPVVEAPAIATRTPNVSAVPDAAASSLPATAPASTGTPSLPAKTDSASLPDDRGSAVTGGGPQPSRAERRPTGANSAPERRTALPPSSPRADRPRLAISRTVVAAPARGTGTGEPFAALPTSAQDAALEEQEVVLRSRIAELSVQVERMQQQRIAELTAAVERLQIEIRATEAAQRAADEQATASPWAALMRWWDDAWPALAALVVLAALVAGGVAWWRRRPIPILMAEGEQPLMPHAAAGLHVDTYLDQAAFTGPETFPRRATPAAPLGASVAGKVSELPHEHEEAFDDEMTRLRRQQRAGKERR